MMILYFQKYDSNRNLIWQTYVPENLDSDFFIKTDSTGNIYIAGTTKWQNLGDPGTYEPSFTHVSSAQEALFPILMS
jgi:hypothetical protein